MFAYFNKPINQCTESELIQFYIGFCNGADPNDSQDQKAYKEFENEVPNRSKKFQETVAYINSVL